MTGWSAGSKKYLDYLNNLFESTQINAVVIDVGSPKGDVETESVVKRVCFLSAVPGGIGPMTIVYLMENVYKAATKGV